MFTVKIFKLLININSIDFLLKLLILALILLYINMEIKISFIFMGGRVL